VDWVLVVPVKRLAVAKSRLGEPWSAYRSELALAFAQDTVAAALAVAAVVVVIVVTDDPLVALEVKALGAEVLADQPDAGQNAALRHGADEVARTHPGIGVGAMSADLPALRSAELAAALDAAAAYESALVCDVSGTGTTLLTGRTTIEPAFGPRSRAAHRGAGALELDGPWPSVRRDVDTVVDLFDARRLGLGPATAAVVAASGLA
jgi:2-phospho-L-lactate/phosphoenolpyruvate guanylyltransferase